jgi:hypothetical protein
VRLGIDQEWRAQILHKTTERESSLFSDTRSISALEEFLAGAVAREPLAQ